MSANTSIEWTDRSWNPVRGCSLISDGCRSCYAMKTAHRFSGPGKPYKGLTRLGPNGPTWTGAIRLVPDALTEPLHWRKPQRVFVNSMSDLFHEGVPDDYIDRVFAVMALAPQHTFQVLTKRAERMRAYFDSSTEEPRKGRTHRLDLRERIDDAAGNFGACHANVDAPGRWPLPNVWLGVSVENQPWTKRIDKLLATPAAVRFISAEPLLEEIDLTPHLHGDTLAAHGPSGFRKGPRLDWVIVGGESGPGARPFDLAWARSIVDQCQAAGVPVFYKQGGRSNHCPHDSKGGCFDCMPSDLQVREFPTAAGATV